MGTSISSTGTPSVQARSFLKSSSCLGCKRGTSACMPDLQLQLRVQMGATKITCQTSKSRLIMKKTLPKSRGTLDCLYHFSDFAIPVWSRRPAFSVRPACHAIVSHGFSSLFISPVGPYDSAIPILMQWTCNLNIEISSLLVFLVK